MILLLLCKTREDEQLVLVEIHTPKHILSWQKQGNFTITRREYICTQKLLRWSNLKIGQRLIKLLLVGLMLMGTLLLLNLVFNASM